MKTSEVLNRAADLIEERGWATGEGWPTVGSTDAPLCLEGGVMAAMGVHLPKFRGTREEQRERDRILKEVDGCPAFQAVAEWIGTGEELWSWNDTRGRTASEVIEVLRATALIEASREREAADERAAAAAVTS